MTVKPSMTVAALFCAVCLAPVSAQDFANYRGTTGNGIYPAVGLLKEWPKEGPPLLWTFNAGLGWAGPSAVDGKVYVVCGRIGQLYTLDMDGKQLGRILVGSMEWSRFAGSRGVPLVKDGVAVVNAPNANYWGIDLATGNVRWQVNAWKSFGDGKGSSRWGVPESPMLIDNKVLFNTCSRTNRQPAIVALDIATGKTIWGMDTPKKYSAADASASWGVHKGRKIYFSPTFCYLICVDADTGELLWEIEDVGAKTFVPVFNNGYLLTGDTKGAFQMMKLSDDSRTYKRLWSRPQAFTGYSQSAMLDNKIFTFGKAGVQPSPYREDGTLATNEAPKTAAGPGGTHLLCIDRDTGETLASRPAPHWPGHIIAADGMVYVTEHENLSKMWVSLIKPTPAGFEQVSTFSFPAKAGDAYEANANTAILDGRLFIRCGGLHCFDIRADIPATGALMDGSGVFTLASPPVKWSMTRNFGWKQAMASASGSAPVAAEGKIFVAETPGRLLCLDAASGAVLWRKDIKAQDAGAPTEETAGLRFPVRSAPVVRRGTVYAASRDGSIAAHDLDGNPKWTASVKPGPNAPALSASRGFILAAGAEVTALDAATGKTAWKFGAGLPVESLANAYFGREPVLVTDGGTILNLADGRPLAEAIFGRPENHLVTVDIADSTAYAVSRKFTVTATALPSLTNTPPSVRWTVKVAGKAPAAPPVCYKGILYIVDTARTLFALDAATGKETGKLALDPDGSSDLSVEPYLCVAGRRLYVQNVGRENATVILQPGPAPSVLWRYATDVPSSPSGFLGDAQFIRAGKNVWCLRGVTPEEPADIQIPTVNPQAFLAGDVKAPVAALRDRTVPEGWLLAGPCFPSTLTTNFLSSLGPVESLALSEGQSHRAGYTTITFHQSGSNDFWSSGHSANLKAFDLTRMTSRKPGTIYAYTVIEVESDMYVEYNPIGPGQYWRDFGVTLSANSWLSGAPIDQGSVVLLRKGRHGLLIQAAVGKPPNDWGKIFMTPHFVNVDEKMKLALRQLEEDKAFWREHAKTKDELIVLKP
jgi:outer membrane protein assembly factor BamB